MATIKPFKALRPKAKKAEQVACVPYDVVTKDQLRNFVDENQLSFLRVTRPRYEFDKGEKPSWDQIFEKAKSNLEWFRSEKILKLDDEDTVYVYRLSTKKHSQTGVVACCSLAGGNSSSARRQAPSAVVRSPCRSAARASAASALS